MKHLLLIILTSSIISKVAFAQNDTLFKSETAPANFSNLSFEEIQIQYSWNDSSSRIVKYFKHEKRYAIAGLCGSTVFLGIGVALVNTKIENEGLVSLAATGLVNFVGYVMTATSGVGLVIYGSRTLAYNKKHLYKELRAYRLNGKVNKKYLKN